MKDIYVVLVIHGLLRVSTVSKVCFITLNITSNMKEAINFAGPIVKIVDSPIPEPNDDQVLIKVSVSGSNPKDWKIPDLAASGDSSFAMLLEAKKGLNQGDDIAGIIEKVGSNVVEFKVCCIAAFFLRTLANFFCLQAR